MTLVMQDEPPTVPPSRRPQTVRVVARKAALPTLTLGGIATLVTILAKLNLTPAWAAVEDEREKGHQAAHTSLEKRFDRLEGLLIPLLVRFNVPVPPPPPAPLPVETTEPKP